MCILPKHLLLFLFLLHYFYFYFVVLLVFCAFFTISHLTTATKKKKQITKGGNGRVACIKITSRRWDGNWICEYGERLCVCCAHDFMLPRLMYCYFFLFLVYLTHAPRTRADTNFTNTHARTRTHRQFMNIFIYRSRGGHS